VIRWYLVMTKLHKDAYAEEQLKNQGYSVYRPLIKKKAKTKIVKKSLFPRYIFIQLDKNIDNWAAVSSTRGVLNIVRFGNNFAEISDEAISILKENEVLHMESSLDIKCLKAGEKVIINHGPFSGFEGLFERYKKGCDRVIILFNMLNKMASLTLAVEHVKKVA